MTRCIVAGSREFTNYELLKQKLDFFLSNALPDVTIVSGGARGADRLGERYANEKKLPIHIFHANWEDYGKRAGYLRNEEMAKNADVLVAFWDGKSHGTKHMIDIATKKGLEVRVVTF